MSPMLLVALVLYLWILHHGVIFGANVVSYSIVPCKIYRMAAVLQNMTPPSAYIPSSLYCLARLMAATFESLSFLLLHDI